MTHPNRRADDHLPKVPLRWGDRWTLLLTGPNHGLIGAYGTTWPNVHPQYERVNVVVEGAPPKLDDIEQYRLQMAAIGTAAIGYWRETDEIQPEYDTVPLREVARLYSKYEELHAFRTGVRTMINMLKNREWAEDLGAHGDVAELQGLITKLVGKLAAASNWISTGPHGDNCFVSDHHEGDPGNRCNCGKDALHEFLESDRPAPDAVEAALADAIMHGTGAFRVHGDGSTEHIDLQAQNRAAAEIVAFSPPPMVRDALYPDYAVPAKSSPDGGE